EAGLRTGVRSGIQRGDRARGVCRTCPHQRTEQRAVALTALGFHSFTGTGIDRPADELVLQQAGLGQVGRTLELQLPGLTRLAINAVYRRAPPHNLMTQTAIHIKSVLVEGIDAVLAG